MKPHRRLMQSLADIANRHKIEANADWNRRYGLHQTARTTENRKARRQHLQQH